MLAWAYHTFHPDALREREDDLWAEVNHIEVAMRAAFPLRRAFIMGCLSASLSVSFLACKPDDTGDCCTVLSPGQEGRIPTATVSSDGTPQNDIALDPAFDCDSLTCVSYQAGKAYCTKPCLEAAECPEGFECIPVLQADPGPDAPIQKGDRFCVKAQHQCKE